MKCIRFPGVRQVEVAELTMPRIESEHDVLIKMGIVGICGSDMHYYLDGRIGDQVVEYPYIPGHECSGTVVETGSRVTRVKPGDQIAIEPAVSCLTCDQCTQGRRHTCRHIRFLGSPGQLDGCLQEYLVMPAENCFPLRDNMDLQQGAFAEPLSISIYGLSFIPDLKDKNIAILGAGPIGLSALLEARYRGAGTIYVTDKINARLSMAAACGADWAGNPDETDVVQYIRALQATGLDYVIECCGKQEALDQAVELLKPGGQLLIIGIPESNRISFDINSIRRHEISIQNVRRQNNCMNTAIDRIALGQININPLITHHAELENAKSMFDLVAGYEDGVIKAMIHVS